MATLITEYAEYDVFTRKFHSGTLDDYDISLDEAREQGRLNEQRARHLSPLLGLLDPVELLVRLPEWLAEKKVGSTNGTTPTMFVGYISSETEDAVRFESSTAARPLMGLAHKMHSLTDEEVIKHVGDVRNVRSWWEVILARRFDNPARARH